LDVSQKKHAACATQEWSNTILLFFSFVYSTMIFRCILLSHLLQKKEKNEQLNTKHLAIIHPQQTTLMIRYS